MAESFESDVRAGARFRFGKNWQRFLSVFNEERLALATQTLQAMLGVETLEGKTFLDIGCGSGLFSLGARRLGARVHSFDFDPDSVACAEQLRKRFFPDDGDGQWRIHQGSVLDEKMIGELGPFDVVYSWGVLHHTGSMWKALDHAASRVADGGLFYIAIYNDQGLISRIWWWIKRLYCASIFFRILLIPVFFTLFFFAGLAIDLASFTNPARRFLDHPKKHRGMSLTHDWLDWLGGFPYEVARPDVIIDHFHAQGFSLCKLKSPAIGFGNYEYVFQKSC